MRNLNLPNARTVAPYLAVAAALVVLFEVMAALFFLVDEGRLPYSGPDEADGTITIPGLQVADAVFHPYAGYVLRATRQAGYLDDTQWRANNRGIHNLVREDGSACCDYPYTPQENEIVVGVFGGSVGSGYALSGQISGTLARLGTVGDWDNKTVRVLNFALPGFKQPQQLMTLAYFLNIGQHFDIVINIDGFNEAVTTFKNWDSGVEPTYPADSLWGAWGRHLDQQGAPASMWNQLSNYHSFAAQQASYDAHHTRLASLKLYRKGLVGWHRWRAGRNAANAPAELKSSGYFPTSMKSPLPEGSDVWDVTVDSWAQASRSMALLAEAHGAIYLHILQPNQWDRATTDYDPIAPDHPYDWVIEPINRVYPAFRTAGAALREQGVSFVDMTRVFDGQDLREMYVDDCCHYTQAGNELVFEATIEAISRELAAN